METITQTLQRMITECGTSHKQLERLCGVNRLSLGRFMRGMTSLSLDQVEMLAKHFGLALLPAEKTKRARKGNT